MDVFYYWKDVKSDMEAGRIGYFRSNRGKLAELSEGAPDFIWVFKTPVGQRGNVQLLARLRWSDKAVVPFSKEADQSYIFYDTKNAESVRFIDGDSPGAINAATTLVKRYFPNSIRANFQGENGQLSLRGPIITELNRLRASLTEEPFYFEAVPE